MTRWLARLPAHRRVLLAFWLVNAVGVLSLILFALRG